MCHYLMGLLADTPYFHSFFTVSHSVQSFFFFVLCLFLFVLYTESYSKKLGKGRALHTLLFPKLKP